MDGCGTDSQAELARFLEFSIKSSMELEYQLKLSRDYGILPQPEWEDLTTDTVNARRMLCGFRAKVRASYSESARKNTKRKNGQRNPR